MIEGVESMILKRCTSSLPSLGTYTVICFATCKYAAKISSNSVSLMSHEQFFSNSKILRSSVTTGRNGQCHTASSRKTALLERVLLKSCTIVI